MASAPRASNRQRVRRICSKRSGAVGHDELRIHAAPDLPIGARLRRRSRGTLLAWQFGSVPSSYSHRRSTRRCPSTDRSALASPRRTMATVCRTSPRSSTAATSQCSRRLGLQGRPACECRGAPLQASRLSRCVPRSNPSKFGCSRARGPDSVPVGGPCRRRRSRWSTGGNLRTTCRLTRYRTSAMRSTFRGGDGTRTRDIWFCKPALLPTELPRRIGAA